ncbi:hypothetical protein BTA30_17980 [Bacillus swezeyi]|uniref:Uncharacterized protein n=1 Tax=Bacillus swezeyi TaxID=1925020 RepID=A0A1R1QSB6_9BACI|nr:hypothetical protein BW143_06565 [Bacillus swezeyi]OMI27342.1 hypothetical protein BTA30_17980 [Bacillus swezeyi]
MLFVSFLVLFTSINITYASDKYRNFAELKEGEDPASYNIFTRDLGTSALIFAPHGGGIEGGTSEIAKELSTHFSTYLFEALKIPGALDLHITSTNFDEPQALDILNNHDLTLSVDGIFLQVMISWLQELLRKPKNVEKTFQIN